ncbi:copper chaperone PCu(A)C [Dyella tabacisoli]|uniref:Copper chaperone PCu(A)C n=1 Tax=Dyella tabacisoli TaxID=2282381 RepID=A0A369UV45_9GAMM|nr:copper chaperone PCu(A)C [Dyella tabacisoli]RDD83608.1 copper chaperone PCu(A)C [Dyella tabacisoli]
MMIRTLSLLAGLWLAGGTHATEADHIHASKAWIRLLPGNLPAGGFVVLENHGDQPASLRAASSSIYADVMLHKSSTTGGMGRMEMVDNLTIPANGKAELSPGGYHLMLMKASKPVNVGDTVKLSLQFSDGSTLNTDFIARPANTIDGAESPSGHEMDHSRH